jgi:hypothetical protein
MATFTDKWATFAVVSGGAAAALTGLLFVAVSIRIDVIARSQELKSRAAQTLALFASVLLVALVLTIPDQAHGVVGGELIALAVIVAAVLIWLGRRAKAARRATSASALGALLEAYAPNTVTAVLLVVAGLLIALGLNAGLDVLVLPVIAALIGGVASAWLLLTKIAE